MEEHIFYSIKDQQRFQNGPDFYRIIGVFLYSENDYKKLYFIGNDIGYIMIDSAGEQHTIPSWLCEPCFIN